MEIKDILEQISGTENRRAIRDYLASLRFETRFNALRELIYHTDLYLAANNHPLADKVLSAAETISRHMDEKSETRNPKDIRALKIITQKKRAKYYDSIGNKKEAQAQYRTIIKGLSLPAEETFLAEMLMELAIIEEQTGQKKEALKKFDQASKIYSARQDPFNYKAALFNCAHVLYDLNFYSKAEEFCRAVIGHKAEKDRIHSPVAHSYLELANIYEIQEKDDKAKAHYRKALEAYSSMNDRIKMSDILNRIGSYEIEEGNTLSASAIFQESLDIKRTVDFMQGRGIFYQAMADACRWGNSPREAIVYYNAAYHYFDEAGCESNKTIIRHSIYKVLRSLGLAREDMGTFVEKYKKKNPDLSKVEELERIDYGKTYGDGEKLPERGEWHNPRSFRVNRRFLVYLLRNLARVNSMLGREKDFLTYSRLRSTVEEIYKKQQ